MDDGVAGQHEVGQYVIVLHELKVEQIPERVQIQVQRMDDQVVVEVLRE